MWIVVGEHYPKDNFLRGQLSYLGVAWRVIFLCGNCPWEQLSKGNYLGAIVQGEDSYLEGIALEP